MDDRIQPTTQQVEEAANLDAFYTNFARVTRAPEELVLDFGLNLQGPGGAAHPVKIERRLVMNYYTAKRLLGVLGMAVQGYEQTFGPLETDVNKRAQIQSR
ncbi:MAG TPA: DUF3467 domain-containing protein [Planctomycetaceae bacterium]|nr:DUF3467 domain-containing protein [Planctomycetaceae bacterium]